MLEYTSVSAPAAPILDDRACLWVRDLRLKAKNPVYLRHPDFLPGYQYGRETYQNDWSDQASTLEYVIDEIERSLSHTLYEMNAAYWLDHHSYAWQVGALFGYLSLLLQSSADQFPFLVYPVHSVQAVIVWQ